VPGKEEPSVAEHSWSAPGVFGCKCFWSSERRAAPRLRPRHLVAARCLGPQASGFSVTAARTRRARLPRPGTGVRRVPAGRLRAGRIGAGSRACPGTRRGTGRRGGRAVGWHGPVPRPGEGGEIPLDAVDSDAELDDEGQFGQGPVSRGADRWRREPVRAVPAELMVVTAPQAKGNCTQIAYVANNPGYDSHTSPALSLHHAVVQTGPACPMGRVHTASPKTSATTTPPPTPTPAAPSQTPSAVAPTVAAPPAPPNSPAPASCYPLSDEGTCYEPGEYCRYSDQGMPGVAGDGQAIICEDNDGLRWEPA
jgi:hypothetical protein